MACSVGGVFEPASLWGPRRRSHHRSRIPGVRSSTRHRGTKAKPADSEIVSTAKVSGGYTNNRNTAEEKKHRQARADRCDAVPRALAKRLSKIETQRLAALILIDGLDQMGHRQAASPLGDEISVEDDNYRTTRRAMAAWLEEHPDPTWLLAALAIGHLETRGTKSSSLGGYGDTISERRCHVIRRSTNRSTYRSVHDSAAAPIVTTAVFVSGVASSRWLESTRPELPARPRAGAGASGLARDRRGRVPRAVLRCCLTALRFC